MDNIFKNAYFGKAYKTKDGRKAVCIDSKFDSLFLHLGVLNRLGTFITYSVNTTTGFFSEGGREHSCELDIVSEWQEEINEEELHKLATEYDDTLPYVTYNAKNNGQETELEMIPWGIAEAFKAGYRKAREK